MIDFSSFYKSKNNFRLIKRKSSNRKNMDGENDEFYWEIYCKNVQSKEVFGKLMYFETEFFVTEVVAQRCSVKKVFSEISQNSEEKPMPEPLF